MKKAFVIAAMMLFASVAYGQFYVELDDDGVLGEPMEENFDCVASTYYDLEVWIFGPEQLFSFGVILCNMDMSLEFQGFVYNVGGWTPVEVQPGECITIQATDFSFTNPMTLPSMVGVVTYHYAVDGSVDDITLDPSGVLTVGFTSPLYDNVGAVLKRFYPPAATEESSWGAVKGLFR